MKKICLFIIALMLFVPVILHANELDTKDCIGEVCENKTDCEKEECDKKTSKEQENDILTDGKSAILIEASTGKIIYEKNSHDRYAPASMTKIMSMILIMESIEKGKLKWTDTLVTSEHASSMGGSQIFLQPNEKMKVKDLFKAVAIGSANDVVVAIKKS